MKSISFNLLNESHGARLGKNKTPRGDIDTPAFMPVGREQQQRIRLGIRSHPRMQTIGIRR